MWQTVVATVLYLYHISGDQISWRCDLMLLPCWQILLQSLTLSSSSFPNPIALFLRRHAETMVYDRPERLIFRVAAAHRVQSWLCMVRLRGTETTHALCFWRWALASPFFIYISTFVNKSQSDTALSQTTTVTERVVFQIWTCGISIPRHNI